MRAITLSNGNITVNLDDSGQLRDFYFPYIGLENHVLGHIHRLGVWVDGQFWWLANNPDWNCTCHFQKSTMIGETIYSNHNLGLTLSYIDAVDTNKNIFLRKIVIRNHSHQEREVRLFFGQEFLVGEHRLANTAFYDPESKSVLHYKGRRVFLINGMDENNHSGLHDYTIGVWGFHGKDGTYHDAEDGILGKNPVDHGPTDSVVSLNCKVLAESEQEMHYWIAVGESVEEVNKLNRRVLRRTPQHLIEIASNFWHAWVNKRKRNYYKLTESQIALYERSLLVVRTHFDNHGGVIASSDSDRLSYGKEGYTFIWPRDGAFAVMALDNAGYSEVTKPFFEFMADVINEDGYLHHKYLPDKSLGSTWHSSVDQREWLSKNQMLLPIQEDETASIIYALWNHYNSTFDIEMIERMYEKLIYPAGQFMIEFRDEKTGLPKESYDLWEEKLGVATYTICSVFGGLMACAKFAKLLGKHKHYKTYKENAVSIREAMNKYLFSKTRNSFIRTVRYNKKGGLDYEEIIDSSTLLGLWFYNVLPTSDPKFIATYEAVQKYLKDTCPVGGFLRYENDVYYRHGDLSNPWFICTLWDVQLDIHQAKSISQVHASLDKLNWVLKHTTNSGILAEQLDAYDGRPTCVSPLTWSHSSYIDTIVMYLEKMKKLTD
jgi:glucoamylase